MQIVKHMLPVMLAFTLLLAGCSSPEEKAIKEVITNELDLLKDLDSGAFEEYISYEELFSQSGEDAALSSEMKDVFDLFFKDFNYKIMEVTVDKKARTADAVIRLTTIDARSLAADFAKVYLKEEMMSTAHGEDTDSVSSLDNRYQLLRDLLTSNSYEKVETTCSMHLSKTEDKTWIIRKDSALENNLVGNLISCLADPDILSPKDTVTVYFDTIKGMSEEEMSRYFKMQNLLNTEDTQKNQIASALVKQLHKHFDYKIKDVSDDGYQASVTVEITTFDSDSIMDSYNRQFEEYLATADAVIDGEEGRLDKSHQLLLTCIKENTASSTSTITIPMNNDGVSWKMEMGKNLEEALFGKLSSSAASAETDSEEDYSEEETDFEEESDSEEETDSGEETDSEEESEE